MQCVQHMTGFAMCNGRGCCPRGTEGKQHHHDRQQNSLMQVVTVAGEWAQKAHVNFLECRAIPP